MLPAIPSETQEDVQLQEQTADYIRRQNLIPDGTPQLTASSLLLPVRTKEGTAAIVKTVRPDQVEVDAPILLRMYNGNGAVRLLDQQGNLQLIERAVSTHVPLWQMAVSGKDDEVTIIICDTAKKLHSAVWTEDIANRLKDYHYKSRHIQARLHENVVPKELINPFETALSLISELTSTYSFQPINLDLHHWNVLHDENRGWLAIDPEVYMAPAPAALANTITNPYDPTHELKAEFVLNEVRMRHQIELIAEAFAWDQQDLSKFVFIHAIQTCARLIENVPRGHVGLAYWIEASQMAANIAFIKI